MSNRKANNWAKFGVPIIVALRLILPLFLWWNALITTIFVLLADLADGEVFRRALAFKKNDAYQLVDKALDFYWHCFALFYSVRFPAFKFILFFFLLRTVGTILLLVKKDRRILVLFPNVFENLFIFYVITGAFPSLEQLLLIAIVSKLIQEYILHVKQFQFYELLTGKRWA